MPRDGNGVYQLPAGSEAITGETAIAPTHNLPVFDLEADANFARPIVAGGTGANNARDALGNLGGTPFDSTRAVASNTVVTDTDNNALILVDAATADVTVTLPQASTIGDNFRVIVKRIDASENDVIVARSGSDTIDGAESSENFTQYEAREYYSTSTAWNLTASFSSPSDLGGTPLTSRSGDYTGTVGDLDTVQEFTADATYTLPDATTLFNGWRVFVRAAGGIVGITTDSNTDQTFDGLSGRTLADGLTVIVLCDGTNFVSVSDVESFTPELVRFTDDGTWTAPVTATVRFTAIGHGGNGGRGSSAANGGAGGSGGAGGLARLTVHVTSGSMYTIVVPATVGSSTTVTGTDVTLSAESGGSGGNGSGPSGGPGGPGGAGGTAIGGDVNATGGAGTAGANGSDFSPGDGRGGGSVGGLDPNGDGTNTGYTAATTGVRRGGAGVGGSGSVLTGGGSHGPASGADPGPNVFGFVATSEAPPAFLLGTLLQPRGGGGVNGQAGAPGGGGGSNAPGGLFSGGGTEGNGGLYGGGAGGADGGNTTLFSGGRGVVFIEFV